MAAPLWASKYVGLRFKDGGREFDGIDCWGLIRLVLMNEKGISVPSYGEISADDLLSIARKIGSSSTFDPWRKVTEPREFDVVLMSGRSVRRVQMDNESRRAAIHVGIMVSSKFLLHADFHAASVCMRTNDPLIRYRVMGFYRHKELE